VCSIVPVKKLWKRKLLKGKFNDDGNIDMIIFDGKLSEERIGDVITEIDEVDKSSKICIPSHIYLRTIAEYVLQAEKCPPTS